jgi:hypothetical protein
MQKLGTRPRSSISKNICFEFSVQCGLDKSKLFEFIYICIHQTWRMEMATVCIGFLGKLLIYYDNMLPGIRGIN